MAGTTFNEEQLAHPFRVPEPTFRRAPCPGLQTLANHGYIPRDGRKLPFFQTVQAIRHVYNLSFSLALLLTLAGYLTRGNLNIHITVPHLFSFWLFNCLTISWTLDLDRLSHKSRFSIAHSASLVHKASERGCSTSPDPVMVKKLMSFAPPNLEDEHDEKGPTLIDLARLRVTLEKAEPISLLHQQISQGEMALGWILLCDKGPSNHEDACEAWNADSRIPSESIQQWFGEEKLPDGWWDGGRRPRKEIGLLDARKWAEEVRKDMEDIRAQRL
ncbi:hypothetical protein DL96DRAFT_1813918 [Flagelloscypha sp. PMI_526]|nr:hypothetical protein DL96DRAFT_1813918 [Flagelloscypha sp. PMI_526]